MTDQQKRETLVPYEPTNTIKNKLLHHEGTKSTKFFNDSPLLRVPS